VRFAPVKVASVRVAAENDASLRLALVNWALSSQLELK